MIILKVYSLRTKRWGIFFVLGLCLLMMLFLLWSNWTERAVFKALRKEITLILMPGQQSVVYLGEERIGESRETPYIFTINMDDSINIRLEPITGNSDLTPVEKVLNFQKGKLVIPENKDFWNHMSINQWPNQVYEIIINLPTTAKMDISDKETIIKEERADLDQDNDLESLAFIKQGQYYFIQIDQGDKVLLKDYQEDQCQWFVKDVNEDGDKEIVIKGQFGQSHEYIEIYKFQEEKLQRIFWEYGEDIALFAHGRMIVGKRLFDTTGHYVKTIYQWENEKYIESEKIVNWWKGSPQWPMDKSKTIKAFFEAYQLGLMEEAKGYLVEEYQTNDMVNIMAGKVEGDWRHISYPNYYFFKKEGQQGKAYMAFTYDRDIHPAYNQVRVYEFEMELQDSQQGPWKIKGIQEATDYSF